MPDQPTRPTTWIWVREHRGTYEDAMSTAARVPATTEAVLEHFKEKCPLLNFNEGVEVKRYGDGKDPRNDWDTHIVTWVGQGIGFTSGPLCPQVPDTSGGELDLEGILDAPAAVGSAEYREIYELVITAEDLDIAIGIADEFKGQATSIGHRLRAARRVAELQRGCRSQTLRRAANGS